MLTVGHVTLRGHLFDLEANGYRPRKKGPVVMIFPFRIKFGGRTVYSQVLFRCFLDCDDGRVVLFF